MKERTWDPADVERRDGDPRFIQMDQFFRELFGGLNGSYLARVFFYFFDFPDNWSVGRKAEYLTLSLMLAYPDPEIPKCLTEARFLKDGRVEILTEIGLSIRSLGKPDPNFSKYSYNGSTGSSYLVLMTDRDDESIVFKKGRAGEYGLMVNYTDEELVSNGVWI